MEHFSYKGGCGIYECMHIKAFKRRAGWGYNMINGFGLLVVKCLTTVIPLRN